jgi:murein DD-endopeptidase MepM/ murein hydrolase activator NlpD
VAIHPLVRAAAAAAVLAALGMFDRPKPPPAPILSSALPGSPAAEGPMRALCGARRIPEGSVCIPLPAPGAELTVADPLEPAQGSHPALNPTRAGGLEPGRGLEVYDHIPRRPDRPADLSLYALPIGDPGERLRVIGGYDLDLPGNAQRRTAHAVGHGGIDIEASRGQAVSVVTLENQEGEAEVAFIGELFGTSVVTGHLVREAGRLRSYAVIYGHLEGPRAALLPGMHLEASDLVGFAGDSGSPGVVHLHLEIRQLREGVSLSAIDLQKLVNNAVSIPCDPRNVLPLRAAAPAP